MKRLQNISEFETLKNEGTHVFYFTAGWCPDCTFIEPFMPDLEREFPEFTFVKTDRDQFIDLCRDLDIFGIPSFVVYHNGKEIGRFVSKNRKTKEEVAAFLRSLSLE